MPGVLQVRLHAESFVRRARDVAVMVHVLNKLLWGHHLAAAG